MKKICGNCKNFEPDGIGRGQCSQIEASYEVLVSPPTEEEANPIRDFNSPCIKNGKRKFLIYFEPKLENQKKQLHNSQPFFIEWPIQPRVGLKEMKNMNQKEVGVKDFKEILRNKPIYQFSATPHITANLEKEVSNAVKEWLTQYLLPDTVMVHSQHQNECIQGLINKLNIENNPEEEGKE